MDIRKVSLVSLLVLTLLCPSVSMAGEALFGYVYTTDTLPKNKWQVNQWFWAKYLKVRGRYLNLYARSQIEYGLKDNIQLAINFNNRYVSAKANNRDGTTGGENIPQAIDRREAFNKYSYDSTSLESIFRFLSPFKDPLGLAFHLEPGGGQNNYFVKPKLVIQKNFLDDQLTFSVNNTWSLLWRKQNTISPTFKESYLWTKQMEFENTFGFSYRFINNWYGGLEFRNLNSYTKFSLNSLNNSTYFIGPNLHFGSKRYWVTTTVLFQLPVATSRGRTPNDDIEGGMLLGNSSEKMEARIKMGTTF